MATLSDTSKRSITGLGQRLRRDRLRRGQSRTQYSKSLGLSKAALRSMEIGRPGVTIGQWAETLRRLKRLEELDRLLCEPGSQTTFEHQSHQRPMRQRTFQLRR